MEREPKYVRQEKGSRVTVGRLVGSNLTRSNMTAPIPKVCPRTLGIPHQQVSPDARLSARQVRLSGGVYGGMVGGQSEPWTGKWMTIVTSAPSSPRILPSQGHNSPIRELDSRWNRRPVDSEAPGSSNKVSPRRKQQI